MPPTRYAPLSASPNNDTDRELDEAFESDNEEDTNDDEQRTLIHPRDRPSTPDEPARSIPGAYDFERERAYDYPPPGSPPPLTSRALPNDIGNSNGLLPSSSSAPNPAQPPRPSFFRRAVGALLPSHYVRVPTQPSRTAVLGGGTENDGVFANVTAKPAPQRTVEVQAADGSIYMVPEENQKEVPPTYADAQADAVPPYWETTVHAPTPGDPNADMIIDDLPTGSIWLFAINLFISWFFQFVGFLFTYLLHTSHAAKYGSRAGLGLTLIQFGFYSKGGFGGDDENFQEVDNFISASRNSTRTRAAPSMPTSQSGTAPVADDTLISVSSRDWLAFLFMTLGWFIFLSSVIGFFRVKRWESSIKRAAEPSQPVTPEAAERDLAIRRNIANVFGLTFDEDEERRAHDMQARAIRAAEDARLTRDLRAAGLL